MSQLLKLKVWTWDWGKIQRRISEWSPPDSQMGGDESDRLPLHYSRTTALCAQAEPQSWPVSSRLQGCTGPAWAFLSHAGLFLYRLLFFFCVLCTLAFIKFHSIGAGISLGFLHQPPPTPSRPLLLLLLKIPFGERIYSKPNIKLSYMRWTTSCLC